MRAAQRPHAHRPACPLRACPHPEVMHVACRACVPPRRAAREVGTCCPVGDYGRSIRQRGTKAQISIVPGRSRGSHGITRADLRSHASLGGDVLGHPCNILIYKALETCPGQHRAGPGPRVRIKVFEFAGSQSLPRVPLPIHGTRCFASTRVGCGLRCVATGTRREDEFWLNEERLRTEPRTKE